MIGFVERDYSLFENQSSDSRPIEIAKEQVPNVGDIIVTLTYLTLEEFRMRPEFPQIQDDFDLEGLDPAESMYLVNKPL